MQGESTNSQSMGILSAAISYILWGILPIYWKLIESVPSDEILAQRIVWSFVFMIIILLVSRKWSVFVKDLRYIITHPKALIAIILASILITINWYTYIWSVNHGHVVETSLGYYINPLVSVLLGMIFLKEKLRVWQMVSFILAAIGVLNLTLHYGSIPWAALTLALSFGLYGLAKKLITLGAMSGLTIETLVMTPVALLFILFLHLTGKSGAELGNPGIMSLLFGGGIVTAIPLLLFASGAKRIPLSYLGFLQYFSPTISLFLGIFLYHEAFTTTYLISFLFIWAALILFSFVQVRGLTKWSGSLKRKKSFEG